MAVPFSFETRLLSDDVSEQPEKYDSSMPSLDGIKLLLKLTSVALSRKIFADRPFVPLVTVVSLPEPFR